MMKQITLILASMFILAVAPLASGTAQAWSLFPDRVCDGAAAKSPTCQEANKQRADENPIANLIGQAANIIALVAGAVAVVMIILAGYQFVTSGGNSEAVTKARGKIVGAIIGLIIIALAWTIIRLVTDNVLE